MFITRRITLSSYPSRIPDTDPFAGFRRVTPAMAAGLTDRRWEIGDLARLLD
jgi:hypothetical protein